MKQKSTFTILGIAFLLVFQLANATVAPVVLPRPINDPDPATVKSAIVEFRNLSKTEKKAKFKSIRNEVRKYKADRKANREPSTNTLLLVILAILLPPLAVYLHEGEINSRFWIDLILTLIFWIPGVIYALIVVLSKEK
jgi:uncharacterized membrane protein YqaE (UPF0057 family)